MKITEIARKPIFIEVFVAVYFGFFILTMGILNVRRPGFAVGSTEYGFPFTYYQSHCFGGEYVYSGLLLNVMTALVLAAAVSLFVNAYWFLGIKPKLETLDLDELRRKWFI